MTVTVTVALATAADLTAPDQDMGPLLGALARLGLAARSVPWDDPTEDWAAFSLVVVRSTWDYVARRDEFLTWARSVPRLANPAPVLDWNTDKRYLADLATLGVPVVDTEWLAPGESLRAPAGEFVVKPTVSSGAADTARYRSGPDDEAARLHVARLHADGRTVMVQPYLESVEPVGESTLVYLGGSFSHAVRKSAVLGPDRSPVPDAVFPRRHPSPEEFALAERALGAVPGVGPADDGLLYARVDVLVDRSGAPVISELELTEPFLFLAAASGATEKFARAIVARGVG